MEISSKGYCVVRRVQQARWVDTLLKSWEDFHLQAQSIFWGGLDKGLSFCTQLQGQDSWAWLSRALCKMDLGSVVGSHLYLQHLGVGGKWIYEFDAA